jgi:hypothetical protein
LRSELHLSDAELTGLVERKVIRQSGGKSSL